MTINNMKEARDAYLILHLLGGKLNKNVENGMKRSVRKFSQMESNKKIISEESDGSSYVSLVKMDVPMESSIEEVDNYFMENHFMTVFYSQYDCTGRPYTGWYKLVKRSNGWFAYHEVCFDV